MKKIGLTGVMGAGKSTVIAIVKEIGITVLDCDAINHELLQIGEAGYTALVSTFGTGLLNEQKQLDKQYMSDLIFSDPIKKQMAEDILHPLIKQRIQDALELHQKEAMVLVEVPLLFEVHWETFFDEIWVVASDNAILLSRLSQFRHISEQEANRRLAHQMSQEAKMQKADVVLWNNNDVSQLRQQIEEVLQR